MASMDTAAMKKKIRMLLESNEVINTQVARLSEMVRLNITHLNKIFSLSGPLSSPSSADGWGGQRVRCLHVGGGPNIVHIDYL